MTSLATELPRGSPVASHARFAGDREAAQRLTNVGASPRGREHDPVNLASWTVVAQAIFNLDEVVTRR